MRRAAIRHAAPTLLDDLRTLARLSKRVRDESQALKSNRNLTKPKSEARKWQRRDPISVAANIIIHRLKSK